MPIIESGPGTTGLILQVNIQVTEQDLGLLADNSLERVLNTALILLSSKKSLTAEDCTIDLERLKRLASSIWYCCSSEVISHYMKSDKK